MVVLSVAVSRVTHASNNADIVSAIAIGGVACAKRWWQQSAVDPLGHLLRIAILEMEIQAVQRYWHENQLQANGIHGTSA